MWNLKKNDTKELIYKTEIDSQTQKTRLSLSKRIVGVGMEEINYEFGINTYTQLYIKQIINEDLLYSTGRYLVTIYNGKECEKEYMCVYN